MRLVELVAVATNAVVGDVARNGREMAEQARLATASLAGPDAAAVVAFPEQSLGGYCPEDLVQWPGFVEAQWAALEAFAQATATLSPVFALGLVVGHEGALFNCAAVVWRGRVRGLVPKEKLPTDRVFYEARTLARGLPGGSSTVRGVPFGDLIFELPWGCLAVEVCEDLWSPEGPLRRRCYAGAELVVNLSASPFRLGMAERRAHLASTRSADGHCVLLYTNAVGGNDGLVFEGRSLVADRGQILAMAEAFDVSRLHVAVDLAAVERSRREATTWRSDREAALAASAGHAGPRRVLLGEAMGAGGVGAFSSLGGTSAGPEVSEAQRRLAQHRSKAAFLPAEAGARAAALDALLAAAARGVGDYYLKTGAFSCIGVALSGGRDSVLTALIAWHALLHLDGEVAAAGLGSARHRELAAKRLRFFSMPSRFSSAGTQEAAVQLAKDLGATLQVVSIDEAFEREVSACRALLGGAEPTPLTLQNIQARIRGQRMWNWANASGGLFLQTGNMSERAMGYTTVGGDLEGALSVIGNLPKTVVIALLEHLAARLRLPGIEACLATVPGPELAEGQRGEAELMPYEVLDACLALLVGERLRPQEAEALLVEAFPQYERAELREWVAKFVRLFSQSIFKWVQAPLTLHLSELDLERERSLQLPVVSRGPWPVTAANLSSDAGKAKA